MNDVNIRSARTKKSADTIDLKVIKHRSNCPIQRFSANGHLTLIFFKKTNRKKIKTIKLIFCHLKF